MINVDTPRCRVPPPCCWLPSGHADQRPVGRQKWPFVNRSSLLYAGPDGPSALTVGPSLDRPPPSRSSITIDDGVCSARIPIAPAEPSPSLSRDFLPWSFAYAGRRCMPRQRHGRHPQTFTARDSCTAPKKGRVRWPSGGANHCPLGV